MPILNLAIGNAEAHGENVSFVLDARGSRLAPFYDLPATIDWPQMSPRLAMRVGRVGTVDELDGTAWARFAEDAGITFPFLRRRGSAPARGIVSVCGAGPMLAERTGLQAERTRTRWSADRSSSQISGKTIMTVRGFIEGLTG